MDECLQRGMDVETTAAAFQEAIESGAYPKILQARIRRNPSRDLFFLHGTIPDGFLQVATKLSGGLSVLPPVRRPYDNPWPTAPDPQDPDAFWFEHFNVVEAGNVPTYGGGTDPRDIQLAHELRGLNDRIVRMIAPEFQHNQEADKLGG